MNKSHFFIFLVLLLFSCGNDQTDKKQLSEAHDAQLKAIKTISEIETILSTTTHAKKDSIKEVLHELEEALFPIPGYELELSGHEGHDHGHSRPELSTEEIVQVIKELNQQLSEIEQLFISND